MFENGSFYIARRIFENRRLIWVIQQNFIKLHVFPNLKIDMLWRGHCTVSLNSHDYFI